MLPRINRDKAEYARRVAKWLEKNAPYHAQELAAHGQDRGWWDQISYFRVNYKTPEEAGRSIREINLNNTWS